MVEFVRFQSMVPNRLGFFPGVFALVNGLAADRALTPADASWVRASNDRAAYTYTDPSTVAVDCYDSTTNPGARSWFKASSVELLDFARGYLELLDRYGIRWVELRTTSPGRITYEDDVQIVAVPYRYPEDWPFGP